MRTRAVAVLLSLLPCAAAAGCGSGTTVTTQVRVTTITETRAALTTSPPAPRPTAAAASAPGGRGLRNRVIVVDPGHNGGNASAPGRINRLVPSGRGTSKACDTTGTATGDGRLTEAAFNLAVARLVAERLRRRGARVVLTRDDNAGVGPCIDRRAALGNRARADAAISIHADGGPPGGSGFHVIHPAASDVMVAPRIAGPSARLARITRSELARRGLRPANYVAGGGGLVARSDLGGLNLSTVPKVLVELGNMRNASEAADLRRPAWRETAAAGIASALERFVAPAP